jgi:uncharacterized protein (DUF362 family)
VAASSAVIATGYAGYPSASPYSPATRFPEYPFGEAGLGKGANPAYAGVRDALRLLGLDAEHYGRGEWNPLGEIVQPGETVVLKPNFVRDFRETQPGHGDCLITHGAVIRAVLDYVYIALKNQGRIVIADAPQNDADFGAVSAIAGLDDIREFYQHRAGLKVEVYDLRPECAKKIDGVIVGHERLPGDPAGYVKVDLGGFSAFAEVNHLCHLLYGAEYDTGELHRHHHDDVHEYLVSKTVLAADCVINLPKLKTHKKTGLTACMKNLVGINGNKNWLPHHREGTPAQGGDQFADDGLLRRIERTAVASFKRAFPLLGPLRRVVAGPVKAIGRRVFGDTNTDAIRSGNWYGNDTTWRMVIDLNRILLYADAQGQLHDRPIRRVLNVVDAIVCGEGNGPLDPTPKPVGAILAGFNPVAVDLACARLMGFDYRRIPMLHRSLQDHSLPLCQFEYEDVTCTSAEKQFHRPLWELEGKCLNFMPHFGWAGHVEWNPSAMSRGRENACAV